MAQGYTTRSGRSIEATFNMLGDQAADALGAELYREATNILAASQPLVPVDTGALRASGYVTEPERDGSRVVVHVGYGGVAARINPKTGESTANYAIYVHENLDAHHPVGQALYLAQPFNEAIPGMGQRVLQGVMTRLFTAYGRIMGAALGDGPEETVNGGNTPD